MNVFDVGVTIIVLLAIAAAILLFERRRAEEIQNDLRDMSQRRQPREERPGHDRDEGSA